MVESLEEVVNRCLLVQRSGIILWKAISLCLSIYSGGNGIIHSTDSIKRETMVEYDHFRRVLTDILHYLADEEYQKALWVDKIRQFEWESDFYHTIDEIVHFIFDDMRLDERPEEAIGVLLKDESEVEAIKAVVDALDSCIDALRDAQDKEYIEHPGWKDVVSSARKACKIVVSR